MDELELVLIKLAGFIGESNAKAAMTSVELAVKLGVSQQTASRYLIRLEKKGLVKRATKGRKQEIAITSEGLKTLENFSRTLSGFLHKRQKRIIEGDVSSGLGEGAYYIKQYDWKILHALGFHPYPGTLNVKLEGDKPDLTVYSSSRIEGFSHGGRHFGALDLIPIELGAKGHRVECFIALPERTHHKRDIEIISQFNLRSKYNLNDGDKVYLKFI